MFLGQPTHAASLLAALTFSACTCGDPEPETLPESVDPEPPAAPTDDIWPTADLPDLVPATPATEVTVHRDRIALDNHALVATWPSTVLDRARADAPPDRTDWPRLSIRLEAPTADGRAIPALVAALETARRAERSASDSGSGAGVFNLRVESSVPFAEVERVLYSAGLAGYGAPRLILAAEPGDRMLPWPRARPAGAPSEAEIEEALRAVREDASDTQSDSAPESPTGSAAGEARAARLRVADDRVDAYLGDALQAPGCATDASPEQELTMTGDADLDAIARCLDDLRERADDATLTLEVAPALPFGRVAAVLQRATARFDGVHLTSR